MTIEQFRLWLIFAGFKTRNLGKEEGVSNFFSGYSVRVQLYNTGKVYVWLSNPNGTYFPRQFRTFYSYENAKDFLTTVASNEN